LEIKSNYFHIIVISNTNLTWGLQVRM